MSKKQSRAASNSLRHQVEALLEQDPPLAIVQAGDPVLRQRAEPFEGQFSDAVLRDLISAMRITMHRAPGVGLAAPQIGLGLQLAVLEDQVADDDTEIEDPRERSNLPFRVIINPKYEPIVDDGTVAFYEGCLSVEGYQAVVARPRTVRLTGFDEAGNALDEVISGWPARIMQHEIDHLHGTLYLDRAEMRSLATPEHVGELWWHDVPVPAAKSLGFDLPGSSNASSDARGLDGFDLSGAGGEE